MRLFTGIFDLTLVGSFPDKILQGFHPWVMDCCTGDHCGGLLLFPLCWKLPELAGIPFIEKYGKVLD